MSLSKIQAESMNLADTYAFTGSVSGAGGGKLIGSSRITYTAGTVTITTTANSVDTGIDHTYTASSTSNKLLHLVNCTWGQYADGGSAGGLTIYEDDTAITEISSMFGLGDWHQDSSWNNRKGATVHYFASPSSTSAIKYSLYGRGENFRLIVGTGQPLIWTILEIEP